MARKRESQVVDIVNSWLQTLDFHVGDANVISGQAWRDRGEQYGRDARAVLLIDGSPLYAAFNYGEPSWDLSERFRKMLDEQGLWYEMAFGWAIAIYQQD